MKLGISRAQRALAELAQPNRRVHAQRRFIQAYSKSIVVGHQPQVRRERQHRSESGAITVDGGARHEGRHVVSLPHFLEHGPVLAEIRAVGRVHLVQTLCPHH